MHTFVKLTHIPNCAPNNSSHILPSLADKRFFAAAISLIYTFLSEFTKHINLSCLFIVVVFFTKYVNLLFTTSSVQLFQTLFRLASDLFLRYNMSRRYRIIFPVILYFHERSYPT